MDKNVFLVYEILRAKYKYYMLGFVGGKEFA